MSIPVISASPLLLLLLLCSVMMRLHHRHAMRSSDERLFRRHAIPPIQHVVQLNIHNRLTVFNANECDHQLPILDCTHLSVQQYLTYTGDLAVTCNAS